MAGGRALNAGAVVVRVWLPAGCNSFSGLRAGAAPDYAAFAAPKLGLGIGDRECDAFCAAVEDFIASHRSFLSWI